MDWAKSLEETVNIIEKNDTYRQQKALSAAQGKRIEDINHKCSYQSEIQDKTVQKRMVEWAVKIETAIRKLQQLQNNKAEKVEARIKQQQQHHEEYRKRRREEEAIITSGSQIMTEKESNSSSTNSPITSHKRDYEQQEPEGSLSKKQKEQYLNVNSVSPVERSGGMM
ncbi:unnamed protein product [Sympodiomycopsis kandeliae]